MKKQYSQAVETAWQSWFLSRYASRRCGLTAMQQAVDSCTTKGKTSSTKEDSNRVFLSKLSVD